MEMSTSLKKLKSLIKFLKEGVKKYAKLEWNVVMLAKASVTITKSLKQIQLDTIISDAINCAPDQENVDTNASSCVINAKEKINLVKRMFKRN